MKYLQLYYVDRPFVFNRVNLLYSHVRVQEDYIKIHLSHEN